MAKDLRPNVRPRQTNNVRQLKLIHDIKEICSKNEYQTEKTDVIKEEIKQINDLYDKKKSILIPKTNVKPQQPTEIQNAHANSTFFKRPNNYIVYGDKKRNHDSQFIKDYEIDHNEVNHLKISNLPISPDDYEKVIIALEDDIGKGEMIPKERGFTIVKELYPRLNESHLENIFKVSSV